MGSLGLLGNHAQFRNGATFGSLPILNQLSVPTATAYSFAKLRNAYGGSAIRVRRSSDNAETDIGFANNELDTTTLSSFVGSGTAFVSNLYDQSGNNSNVIQTTSVNQPALRRGIVNRLLSSKIYSGSGWIRFRSTVTAQPDGSFLLLGTGNTEQNIKQSFAYTAGIPMTCAAIVSDAGNLNIKAQVSSAVVTGGRMSTFNLTTGIVTGNLDGATMTSLGGGLWLCRWGFTPNISGANNNGYWLELGQSTLDPAKGVYLHGSFLSTGVLTAAEILAAGGIPTTTTAPASSLIGKHFLEFDGVNDLLTQNSAVLQQSSDNWVCASFELTSYPSSQVAIFSNSNTTTINPLVAYLYVTNTGQLTCLWRDDAGVASGMASSLGSVQLGVKYVATAARIGNSSYLWLNGVLVSSGTNILGTTTVNTNTIGALVRTSTTFYLSGKIYFITSSQSTLTESDRLLIENFAINESGIS